jgi:poly [ADP-ribose] polymerase
MESTDLMPVAARFRKIFREKTGLVWDRRYESPFIRDGTFMFVELDYCGAVARPRELPNYAMVDAKVKEEVRDLMEVMLYGGSVRKRNGSENPGTSRSWSAFGAPYEQLSRWTIFLASKTLERIWKHLESGRPIHWKAILRTSSRYRSQIPFCAEHDRVPVISSYHAIFLELKFLHSLWPRQETASMLAEIHRRGSLQFNAYKALAQPLYQAYSSLRHGFRHLTDTSTREFRELKDYLEKSCHHTHYRTLELQGIYRVFIKASLPNTYRDWIEAKQGHDTCGEMRLLLWHGTPLDSLLGILDLGLQIRRRGASWTGTMFGNGIYLADTSSKSAGYCRHQLWDGEAVLLLCEADVGAQRIRSQKSIYNGHDVIEKSGGRHRCIQGLGRVGPMKWKDVGWEMGGLPRTGGGMVLMVYSLKPFPPLSFFHIFAYGFESLREFVTNSCVTSQPDTTVPYSDTYSGGSLAFNEYVVYDPSHVLIRYLFRVKIKNKMIRC